MVISGSPVKFTVNTRTLCLDGRQPNAARAWLAQWATMFRLGPDVPFP
jgi:hypothetical protein